MNQEKRQTLVNLVDEYGHALSRIQAEKELMKLIEDRAVVECGIKKTAHFKLLATAHWKGDVIGTREALESQLDLFDAVRSAQGATVSVVRLAE